MKILFLAFLLRGAISTDTLPERPELFAALRIFHTQNAAAQIGEFENVQIKETQNWMNWLPSVGLGYNLQGQPRPTVGYSLGQVKANIDRRNLEKQKAAQNDLKKAAILRGANLAFFQDSINLEMAVRKVEILRGAIVAAEKVFEVEDKIWEITKGKYDRQEIAPAEYLTALKYQTERAEQHRRRLAEIDIEELNIYRIARY